VLIHKYIQATYHEAHNVCTFTVSSLCDILRRCIQQKLPISVQCSSFEKYKNDSIDPELARITEYEACERLSREIQSQIVLRNREQRLSDEYSKLSGNVRMRLKQFSTELVSLEKKLEQTRRMDSLTTEEAERRQRQIEQLQSKLIQLQNQFAGTGDATRSALLQPGTSRLWDDEEDDQMLDTSTYSVKDLRQQQAQILEDQNQGLEALSKVISRQKDLALRIGDEVETQNEIIDDIADQLEHTDARINSATRRIEVVSAKDRTWPYWSIIIGLFVAIIIACERLSREIQSQIVLRNREQRLSDEYSKLSGNVRMRLKQFSTELVSLEKKLEQTRRMDSLTTEEAERRQRQIEQLQSKLIQLQNQFAGTGDATRSALLQPGTSRLWDDEEDDQMLDTSTYSVKDLRQQQAQILEDQNQGLEALSKVISRQKDLALRIGDEVETQNEIIDDIADQLEHTDARINSATRRIEVVSAKDRTWPYWSIIIGLFVAIIIVALI
uniref:t-SNARE coiled-coil homology domain-containing protein n=1 Tax=Lutzomyia longipalpis TaxID=7200 RepID=A0A1B0CP58_LUTLO